MIAAKTLLTTGGYGLSVYAVPSPLANLGAGLRLLRGVRPQLEVARAAGVDPGTLNKIENGKRLPDSATIDGVLTALGKSLYDLADAIEAAEGTKQPRRTGRPRPEWVSVIRDSGFEVSMFRGLAFAGYSGSSEDIDRVEADLVASAEQVARERALAGARFRRDYETEVALEVAEGPAAVLPTPPPRKGKS